MTDIPQPEVPSEFQSVRLSAGDDQAGFSEFMGEVFRLRRELKELGFFEEGKSLVVYKKEDADQTMQAYDIYRLNHVIRSNFRNAIKVTILT